MQKKINVFQLVEGFGLGGAEKKLLELVQFLDKEKFNVTVCGLGLAKGELENEFYESGVNVIEISRKRKWDFSLILRLANLMKSLKTHVVMTTLFYADVIGPFAARLANVKLVYSWETISSPEWLIPYKLWSYKVADIFRTKIISVSHATTEFLINDRRISESQIITIPYGVNLSSFNYAPDKKIRSELGIKENELVIGIVGRLHPQKGHNYLIDSAPQIIKSVPNSKFLTVGDGPLRSKLEKKVQDNKLEDHFLFTGVRNDIPQVLNAIDIFVLPSLYEGLPNVILEAMATSKAIVATPADGTKEAIVHKESGILVPFRDSIKLADEIIHLAKNPDYRMTLGQNARKRVELYFSLDEQIRKFEELYSL